MGYDEAISYKEIYKAIKECERGVRYKDGPCRWHIHRLTKASALQKEIISKRYKIRKGTIVKIYRPKPRIAIAPWFRDRVWQRSMCNNGLYDDITRSFIYPNMACQIGKGNDATIRLVIKYLQKLIRTSNNKDIYGVHLDVKKYFPSTPHKCIYDLDEEIVTDKRFIPYLIDIINSVEDPRSPEEISQDIFGPRGTGLGSQINQLHQIALLNHLDHEIICICPKYIRYNDDILILDHDKEKIKKSIKIIEQRLSEKGLSMTNKAGIFVVQKSGFEFLRKRFIVTKTGKVVLKLHKRAMADERKVLRTLKKKLDNNLITMSDVCNHYQSWVAYAEYCGDNPIIYMDISYKEIFKTDPVYKRKKRYLYGGKNNAVSKRKTA